MRRWTLGALATAALMLTGCNKPASPAKPTAPASAARAKAGAKAQAAKPQAAKPQAGKTKADTPMTAESTRAAAAAEAKRYSQRRKRKPVIIGGCDASCETPQRAAVALFDGLQSKTPGTTLRHLFDWSILEIDGDKRGDRWSDMWGDRRKHATRNQEIQAWLDGWIAALQQAKPGALLRSRASGVQIKPIPKRTDVVEMRWRHPALPSGGGEPEWRVLWTLRGYEWLISRIDRLPSKRPLGTPPLGSVRKGRL